MKPAPPVTSTRMSAWHRLHGFADVVGTPQSLPALVGDHVVDCVVDRQRRLPASQLTQCRCVRSTFPEFLEAIAIGVLVGDEPDLRVRSGALYHTLAKLEDRKLGRAADVERMAICVL